MELPSEIRAEKRLACKDCIHADRTLRSDEKYCRKRHEIVKANADACRAIEAKPQPPPKPEKVVEKGPVEKAEAPPDLAVYVQVGSREIAGRIIGREGRNIRTLEALTDTDVQARTLGRDTQWFTVVGHPEDARVAARAIWKLTRGDALIHPTAIGDALLEEYKAASKEGLEYFENRLRAAVAPVLRRTP